MKQFLLATALAASCATPPASAATFESVHGQSDPTIIFIQMRGAIELGDDVRFRNLLRDLDAAGLKPTYIDLASPGGNVRTALNIGDVVHSRRITAGILPHETCASACALLFFAAPEHDRGETGRLGVHRAAIDHRETADTIELDAYLAQRLRAWGAPETVVNAMLTTAPHNMAPVKELDANSQGFIGSMTGNTYYTITHGKMAGMMTKCYKQGPNVDPGESVDPLELADWQRDCTKADQDANWDYSH
jgi:hypothetical protein